MAHREIKIPFSEIEDAQKITEVNERKFREQGLNMHLNEVDELVDDHSTKTRILKVRSRKYFGPWRHRR